MADFEQAPEGLAEFVGNLIYQAHDNGLDPKRPYDGQPHTDQGERGKTLVAGLTMRDVCDCFVVGWLMASGRSSLAESGTASYNDVYEGDDVDPLAVMQNMMCEVERKMGIFPNIAGSTLSVQRRSVEADNG